MAEPNPIPSGPVPSPTSNPVEAIDPRLEDYLDRIFAPLVGIVPYARRQEMRREAASHLLELDREFRSNGYSKGEALAEAMQRFGDPIRLSRDWTTTWQHHRESEKSAWPAFLAGLAFLAPAALFSLTMLSANAWIGPGDVYYHRERDAALFIACLLPPLLPGFLTGMFAPGRSVAGFIYATAVWLATMHIVYFGYVLQTGMEEGSFLFHLRGLAALGGWFFSGGAAAWIGHRLRRVSEESLRKRFFEEFIRMYD